MEKITVGQFLMFTNYYVTVYIEDEFQRYDCKYFGKVEDLITRYLNPTGLTEKQKECPIDYIRNVDGGHFGDDEKRGNGIVLGIGIENYEKYFGKE